MEYNLEERTAQFSEESIAFSKLVKKSVITLPLITQFIRAATSIGANYTEATNASSKKDFKHKIYICKKEAQETKYWLRMLRSESDGSGLHRLEKECHELLLIFQKIITSCNKIKIEN